MIDIKQKKDKIISFLDSSGPSIPVRIAKTIEMDPVFASAILSELLNSKEIKMSNMKIGSSPLYFLQGQEKRLEEHIEHLKSAEKEAYLKLKEKVVLNDEKEEPAIRVALRSLKDFAIPFKLEEKIMWRYAFSPNEEIQKKINKKEDEKEKINNQKTEERPKEPAQRPEEKKERPKIEEIFEEKPEFLNEVKKFLEENDIEFLEEIKTEKKEVVAKVNIKTVLGKIKFLLIAKNKMTTSKEEIKSCIQQAIYNNLPCILIIRKEPTNTIKKLLEENHLIKLKIMKAT